MASSTIRKAIGVVKDQTSIGIAKVAGNLAPDLEVLIVKATSHEELPADDRYIREILSLTSCSRGYVNACVITISKRISKTRDWIVALKALMLVHRLLVDGHPLLEEEIVYAARRGMRILNVSGFRDEAHSNSWDHSDFVRLFAMYLDGKVEFVAYQNKIKGFDGIFEEGDDNWDQPRRNHGEFRDEFSPEMSKRPECNSDIMDSVLKEQRSEITPVREMKPERLLVWLDHFLRILDRVLACRLSGAAKSSRLVLVALDQIVRDSFGLYVQICKVLGVLLDRFPEMEHTHCVKAFDAYVSAAKMIDELVGFYGWCKDMGIARSSEYPEVQRITDVLLGTLEGFLKMDNKPKNPEKKIEVKPAVRESEPEPDMNEVKALPSPVNFTPPPASVPQPEKPPLASVPQPKKPPLASVPQHKKPPPASVPQPKKPPPASVPQPKKPPPASVPQPKKPLPASVPQPNTPPPSKKVTNDLVDLRDGGTSADEQGSKLALALFSGAATVKTDGSWEAFPSNGESEVTSAWQTPAAEAGKADWELVLVETASNLSKQKVDLAGGFDPLLLNGIYDQGVVRRHVITTEMSGGSASSVTLPGHGKSSTPVLALPAPDGTLQAVGPQDPFAASLSVPPPSYVQIADMERKQQLLVQEQQVWQQYGRDRMQGQLGFKVAGGVGYYGSGPQPYGMPQFNGMGQPAGGYYYAPY